MGLLRTPNIDKAPAGAKVRFCEDSVAVEWYGDLALVIRSPHIYLDWAVNKDQREGALGALAAILDELNDEGPGRLFDSDWELVDEVTAPIAEVTVALTDTMRCKVAFRPRRRILAYLYPTFIALWNELVTRTRDEPGAIEPLVHDLRTQIDYYDQHGVGMRGGVAPIYAGRVGAGRRLEEEIADFAGLSVAEFRALPELERDKIFDRHTRAGLGVTESLDDAVSKRAGLTTEEFLALPPGERDALYEEWFRDN